MHDSPLPREQLASIVKNLLPSRRKRAAGTWDAASAHRFQPDALLCLVILGPRDGTEAGPCGASCEHLNRAPPCTWENPRPPDDPLDLGICLILASSECPADKTITEEVVMDELMPIYYTPEELQACLQGVTLVTHLALMMQYPFTDQQLAVLKKKLDEMYPNGYPDKIIPNLGAISSFVTIDDIKKWNITSADTLAFLLSNEPPNEQVISYQLNAYLFGFAPWFEILIFMGAAYFIQSWVAHPGSLDQPFLFYFWFCATSAVLSGFALFCFFPTPGGAPGEDLRALSKDNVNMDIGTFMSLKKDSVLNLTADDIKGLLGLNLDDLKNQQYNSPAKDWIRLQRQSELNKLDIGLTGGIPDGYISLPPKVENLPWISLAVMFLLVSLEPTSASLRTIVRVFHLLPALLLSFLLTSFLS
uniref:Uncharacterized protein n=1 Tax=Chelydra serpentina TaxID=8475 RepID=A0A8C3SGH5_CHESE